MKGEPPWNRNSDFMFKYLCFPATQGGPVPTSWSRPIENRKAWNQCPGQCEPASSSQRRVQSLESSWEHGLGHGARALPHVPLLWLPPPARIPSALQPTAPCGGQRAHFTSPQLSPANTPNCNQGDNTLLSLETAIDNSANV